MHVPAALLVVLLAGLVCAACLTASPPGPLVGGPLGPGHEAPAAVRTTIFDPTADASVSRADPDQALGGSPDLRVHRDGDRAYLRFDVSGLAAPVIRAELRLRATTASRRGVSVRSVEDGSWTEEEVTFDDAPRVGPAVSHSGSFQAGPVSIDATALVGGNGQVDLALADAARRVAFASREASSDPPRLVVTTSRGDPVIAAAGDIACDPEAAEFNDGAGTPGACQMRATASILEGVPNLAAVLPLGDLQYPDGSVIERWDASYDPTWGRFKWLSHPAIGNHEYGGDGPGLYFDHFGGLAGPPGRGYYSFDVGAWHLVALNSECTFVPCDARSPQARWLRKDLAANPDRCTLAYWHRPLFSTGLHGGHPATQDLWNVLFEAGADIVLNGHDHGYERFARMNPSGARSPRGIREFVVGTGGHSHYPFPGSHPASEVRTASTFGVLLLTLREDGYAWRFQSVPGSSFTDSGSGRC